MRVPPCPWIFWTFPALPCPSVRRALGSLRRVLRFCCALTVLLFPASLPAPALHGCLPCMPRFPWHCLSCSVQPLPSVEFCPIQLSPVLHLLQPALGLLTRLLFMQHLIHSTPDWIAQSTWAAAARLFAGNAWLLILHNPGSETSGLGEFDF